MSEAPLYKFRGYIKIGKNIFWSFGFLWPAASIIFYSEKLVVHAPFYKKTIPYSKIKRLSWTVSPYHDGFVGFIGRVNPWIQIDHEAGGPSYIAFSLFRLWFNTHSKVIIEILQVIKSRGVIWDEVRDLHVPADIEDIGKRKLSYWFNGLHGVYAIVIYIILFVSVMEIDQYTRNFIASPRMFANILFIFIIGSYVQGMWYGLRRLLK